MPHPRCSLSSFGDTFKPKPTRWFGCRWSGRGSEALAGLSPETDAEAVAGRQGGESASLAFVARRDEYFRMKLQWKSVSPEQERRNSLLHGYRSLIGGWGQRGPAPSSRDGRGEGGAGREGREPGAYSNPSSATTHRGILASGLTPGPQFPHLWVTRDRRLQGAQHLSPVFRCFRDWLSLYLSHLAPHTPSPQREM